MSRVSASGWRCILSLTTPLYRLVLLLWAPENKKYHGLDNASKFDHWSQEGLEDNISLTDQRPTLGGSILPSSPKHTSAREGHARHDNYLTMSIVQSPPSTLYPNMSTSKYATSLSIPSPTHLPTLQPTTTWHQKNNSSPLSSAT